MPAACLEPFLVPRDGLLGVSGVLVALCEVEEGAGIGRISLVLGQQQPNVSLELVRLGAAIVDVVDGQELGLHHLKMKRE